MLTNEIRYDMMVLMNQLPLDDQLELTNFVVDLYKTARTNEAQKKGRFLKKGQRVSWVSKKRGGVKMTGTIHEVKRTNALVLADNSGTWNIPMNMLTLIEK